MINFAVPPKGFARVAFFFLVVGILTLAPFSTVIAGPIFAGKSELAAGVIISAVILMILFFGALGFSAGKKYKCEIANEDSSFNSSLKTPILVSKNPRMRVFQITAGIVVLVSMVFVVAIIITTEYQLLSVPLALLISSCTGLSLSDVKVRKELANPMLGATVAESSTRSLSDRIEKIVSDLQMSNTNLHIEVITVAKAYGAKEVPEIVATDPETLRTVKVSVLEDYSYWIFSKLFNTPAAVSNLVDSRTIKLGEDEGKNTIATLTLLLLKGDIKEDSGKLHYSSPKYGAIEFSIAFANQHHLLEDPEGIPKSRVKTAWVFIFIAIFSFCILGFFFFIPGGNFFRGGLAIWLLIFPISFVRIVLPMLQPTSRLRFEVDYTGSIYPLENMYKRFLPESTSALWQNCIVFVATKRRAAHWVIIEKTQGGAGWDYRFEPVIKNSNDNKLSGHLSSRREIVELYKKYGLMLAANNIAKEVQKSFL